MSEGAELLQHESVAGSMESLSCDLWLSVLRQLDWRSLVHASGVCRQWRSLISSCDWLWQPHFQERHSNSPYSRCSSNEMGGCAISLGGTTAGGQCLQVLRAMEVLGVSREVTQQCSGQRLHQHQHPFLEGDGRDTPPAALAQELPADSQQDMNWQGLLKSSLALERNRDRGRVTHSCRLNGHADLIRCMQLSGNTLVSCSGSTSHADCSVRVWDVQTGSCNRVLRGHLGPIWCLMYEPSLDRIASGSDDYTVRYWDASSGNSVVMEDPDSAVRCVHMDAVGRQLVAGTEFGRLLLWDMEQLEEVLSDAVQHVVEEYERMAEARTPLHGGRPASSHGMHAVRHGGSMVAGNNPDTGNIARAMSRRSMVQRAEVLLAGRHVVADNTNHVRLMDMAEEGKAISAIQVQSGLCATTSIEPLSYIQLWDVSRNSWVPAGTLGDVAMQYANSLSFDKQVGVLVAGCGDRRVRVWDLATGARRHLLSGHTGDIYSHQFDERRLATAALDGRICVWDMRTGHCQHVLQHDAPVHAFQYHGDRLVSGTWDGHVCLWDLRKGSLVQEWQSHAERVWAVAINDFHMASAGLDHTICLHSFAPSVEDNSAVQRATVPGATQRLHSMHIDAQGDTSQQMSNLTNASKHSTPATRNLSFTDDEDNAILKRALGWQHQACAAGSAQGNTGDVFADHSTQAAVVQATKGAHAQNAAFAQMQHQQASGRRSPDVAAARSITDVSTAMQAAANGHGTRTSPGSASSMMADMSNSDGCPSMSRSVSPGATDSEEATNSEGRSADGRPTSTCSMRHCSSRDANDNQQLLAGTCVSSQAISLSPSPSSTTLNASATVQHMHSRSLSQDRRRHRGLESSMSCNSSVALSALGCMSRAGSDLMADDPSSPSPCKQQSRHHRKA